MSDIASVTTQELQALRPVIREHWLRNDLPQAEVINKLGQFYGVQLSPAQFRDIVTRGWQYWKNLLTDDWKYVNQEKMKRGDKPSDAIVAGVVVRRSKEIARRVKDTFVDSYGPQVSKSKAQSTRAPASEWLSVGSPPPHEADIILFDAMNLPTVVFLKAESTSTSEPYKNINTSAALNPIGISAITLSPDNMSWAIGLAAFGLAHGLRVQLALLADGLGSRQDCHRHVLLPLAFREECSILPRESPKDALRNCLELLVYFLVNKMTPSFWSRSEDQQLIELVFRTSFLGLLKASPNSHRGDAVISILENIFGSAVRLGHVGLVRDLLEAGANINQPVDPIYHLARLQRVDRDFGNISSMTPLQLAVCIDYTELARFLLNQGAETHRSLRSFSIMEVAIMSARSGDTIDPEMFHLFLPMVDDLTEEQCFRAWLIANISHSHHALSHIFDVLPRFEFDPIDYAGFFISALQHGMPEIADHILTNNEVDLEWVASSGVSPLAAAVMSDNVDLCRKLLRMGASATLVEDFIIEGEPVPTTLQMAAMEGSVDIVRLLIQEGSPVNFNFPLNQTPTIIIGKKREVMLRTALQAALLSDDQKMAIFLLDLGAKPIGGEYVTAVLRNFHDVRYRLEQQGITIHDTLHHGQTVLEAAIISSNFDLACSIMENYPNSITAAVLVSVVHMAVRAMSLQASEEIMLDSFDPLAIPRELFKHVNSRLLMGVDVLGMALEDDLLGMALVIAAWNHKSELVHLLLDNGLRPVRCPSRLHILDHLHEEDYSTECWEEKACCWMPRHGGRGGEESVAGMFTMGADLASFNYLFDCGYAPDSACMGTAVHNEDQPLVRMKRLLLEGATVNDREPDQDTPLQSAISTQHDDIVRWLLKNDADVNLPPGLVNGRTALQAAAETGNSEILDILINKKADVNAPPAKIAGGTALQLAAAQGYIGIAETLIKWDADVDAAAGEQYGRTALEGAAEHNKIDMVKVLLACGAKTTGAWQKQYIRAIKFAERQGHGACAGLLRKHRPWTDLDTETYRSEDLPEDSGGEIGQCQGCALGGRHCIGVRHGLYGAIRSGEDDGAMDVSDELFYRYIDIDS